MSFDAYAYTIIGLKVEKDKIYKMSKKRLCEHQIPEDANFCHVCGQKAYKEAEEIIPLGKAGNICGFGIISIHNYLPSYFLVEKYVECSGDGWNAAKQDRRQCKMGSFDLEEIKQRMKKALEPHGLWDEENFGIWCVCDL